MHLEIALNKLKLIEPKYKQLDFKYLPFNGASGLKLFVDEFPVSSESYTFAFVDRDQAGCDSIKEALGFVGKIDDFIGNLKNNIHINYIPKKDGFAGTNYVIEDYYPFEIYKDFLLNNVNSVCQLPNNSKSNFKTNFANAVEKLEPDVFEGFRKIFDLIIELKSQDFKKNDFNSEVKITEKNIIISKDLHKDTLNTIIEEGVKVGISPNTSSNKSRAFASKEAVLLRKTNADLKKSYLSIQNALFNGKIKGIKYRVTNKYISILVNRPFAYFYFTKNQIKLVVMKDYSTVDELIKNHNVVELSKSVKAFYRGECAGVLIEENNNLEEIVNLLVQIQR
jgi:hypothetical protein